MQTMTVPPKTTKAVSPVKSAMKAKSDRMKQPRMSYPDPYSSVKVTKHGKNYIEITAK